MPLTDARTFKLHGFLNKSLCDNKKINQSDINIRASFLQLYALRSCPLTGCKLTSPKLFSPIKMILTQGLNLQKTLGAARFVPKISQHNSYENVTNSLIIVIKSGIIFCCSVTPPLTFGVHPVRKEECLMPSFGL